MKSEAYLEALLTLPRLYAPKISKDGAWIAWTWTRTDPRAEVYCAPCDGSASPLRLTSTDQDTFLVSWTPDSKSVIVAQDRDGNERNQLFQVDLEKPEELIPLTEADPNFFLRGGDLHPNGRWLIYCANLNSETGQEIEASWVFRHDLQTRERMPLARPSKPAYYAPQLNQAGSHILYARKDLHPSGRQVWMVDIEGAKDEEIFNAGEERKAYASWFPDGRRILLLAELESHRKLGILDRETRDLVWLIDDPERNIENAFVPPNGKRIVVLEVQEARLRASLLDPETGREQPLPPMPFNVTPFAPLKNNDWIGVIYSAQQPEDIARFPLDAADPGEFRSLTHVWDRTPLTPEDLTPAEDFLWQAVDGIPIQGWLYRARQPVQGTIIFVHGGPTYHLEDQIHSQMQYLVSQGFNVLAPNYRGSTGFGLDFQEAIKDQGWGGDEQEDIRAGIQALIKAGIAQPGKIGITGTSYGGYSSWWAITQFPTETIAAAAPVCGMTDLVVDYETTRPDLRPYSEEMMGGSPEENPERYFKRSPINFVENIRGALLIIQGMQDPNVTPENVREVRQKLDQAGIPYEVLAFEDEGHGIFRTANMKVLYPRLAKFFREVFKD